MFIPVPSKLYLQTPSLCSADSQHSRVRRNQNVVKKINSLNKQRLQKKTSVGCSFSHMDPFVFLAVRAVLMVLSAP